MSTDLKLGQGLRTLSIGKDLILCDVWGVIHNGVRRHEPAVDALVRFRGNGGTVVLITNAPVPEAQVIRRLDAMGVTRGAYDRVATSGDVTVDLIIAAGCPPLFNIGATGDVAIYGEAARLGPRQPPHVGIEDAELAVCLGLDETRPKPADYDAALRALLRRDLDLICANPDLVVEVGDELVFCAGSVADRYAAMGGRVIHAGKPYAALYQRAFAMAKAIKGETARDRVLAIGDALRTDIAGAADQGLDSLLITTGIHRAQLHAADRQDKLDDAALAHFLGSAKVRPTAVAPRLSWDV